MFFTIFLIFIVVFIGSLLTFFSSFGLGTLLLPIFSIFFPIKIAVFATSIVHFSNSIFKFILLKKYIKWKIVFLFGISAILFALLGSLFLGIINDNSVFYSISLFENKFNVNTISFVVSILILIFTLFELFSKHIKNIPTNKSSLIIGGVLSGFFGGLSGHQGALRSLFLKKTELSKEELIATSTFISLCIDISRISVYFIYFSFQDLWKNSNKILILVGILSALLAVIIGTKVLKKINLNFIHHFITLMLIIFSLLMLLGII